MGKLFMQRAASGRFMSAISKGWTGWGDDVRCDSEDVARLESTRGCVDQLLALPSCRGRALLFSSHTCKR